MSCFVGHPVEKRLNLPHFGSDNPMPIGLFFSILDLMDATLFMTVIHDPIPTFQAMLIKIFLPLTLMVRM